MIFLLFRIKTLEAEIQFVEGAGKEWFQSDDWEAFFSPDMNFKEMEVGKMFRYNFEADQAKKFPATAAGKKSKKQQLLRLSAYHKLEEVLIIYYFAVENVFFFCFMSALLLFNTSTKDSFKIV